MMSIKEDIIDAEPLEHLHSHSTPALETEPDWENEERRRGGREQENKQEEKQEEKQEKKQEKE